MTTILAVTGGIVWSLWLVWLAIYVGTGIVRAISLHHFYVRLLIAMGKRPVVTNRIRDWPLRFWQDAREQMGLPWNAAKTIRFSKYHGPLQAHWNGVGAWWIEPAAKSP